MALLNQQQRFEAFDHCYHLLKVNQVDAQSEKVNNVVNIVNSFKKYRVFNLFLSNLKLNLSRAIAHMKEEEKTMF